MATLPALLSQLETLAQAETVNESQASKIITELKIWSNSIDVTQESLNKNSELLGALRRFEELLINVNIKTKNFDEFENAYKRLKVYNEDLAHLLPKSQELDRIVGLYLLYLLSFNRFADFHTELEKVGEADQQNQYIKFAITLEQSLAVGNYSNLFESRKKSPLAHFNVFLDRILETIRHEIARSSEKAYDNLQLDGALKVFLLNSRDELNNFIQQERKNGEQNGIEWRVENNQLRFIRLDDDQNKLAFANSIPDVLNYAQELEKII
jgi:26S proteasome regulatory subunit N12